MFDIALDNIATLVNTVSDLVEAVKAQSVATAAIPGAVAALLKSEAACKQASKLSETDYKALKFLAMTRKEVIAVFSSERVNPLFPIIREEVIRYSVDMQKLYKTSIKVDEVRDIQPKSFLFIKNILNAVFPGESVMIDIARKGQSSCFSDTKFTTDLETRNGIVTIRGETDMTLLYREVPICVFEAINISVSSVFSSANIAQIGVETKAASEQYKSIVGHEPAVFEGIMTSGCRWVFVRRFFHNGGWSHRRTQDDLASFDLTSAIDPASEAIDAVTFFLIEVFKNIAILVEKIKAASTCQPAEVSPWNDNDGPVDERKPEYHEPDGDGDGDGGGFTVDDLGHMHVNISSRGSCGTQNQPEKKLSNDKRHAYRSDHQSSAGSAFNQPLTSHNLVRHDKLLVHQKLKAIGIFIG